MEMTRMIKESVKEYVADKKLRDARKIAKEIFDKNIEDGQKQRDFLRMVFDREDLGHISKRELFKMFVEIYHSMDNLRSELFVNCPDHEYFSELTEEERMTLLESIITNKGADS